MVSRPSRPALAPPALLPNEPPACEQAQATDRQTEAIDRLTAKIDEALTEIKPAIGAIQGLGDGFGALCRWLRKWGPWFLASAPGVLVATGAMSENAGAALKAFLAGGGLP